MHAAKKWARVGADGAGLGWSSSAAAMPSISSGSGQSATTPTQCVQFLNTVLSRREHCVPYEEDLKWSIRQHLVNVVQGFPGLQVRTATFHHNDGRQVNLLQADGTIPMFYQNVKYNIPVTIWLLEEFPRQAPLVYVTPTRDMIIKPRHPFVDPSGTVTVPYLQQWVFPSSNLVELVDNLSLMFGQDPPLYSRPASSSSASQRPQQQQQQQQQQQIMQGMLNPVYSRPGESSSAGSPAALGPVRPPYPPPYFQQQGNSSSSQQQQQQQPPRTEDPADVFRRNVVGTLTDRVQQDILGLRRSCEVEMDEMFNVQATLNQRSEQLSQYLQQLRREKEALEQQLQMVLTNTDVLETWVQANSQAGAAAASDLDIDSAFEPCDALSKQMLECSAEDMAIEDTLYALDKAVHQDVISPQAYLKHIRDLAREQFFSRAKLAKVRAAQTQAQVSAMAARVPG